MATFSSKQEKRHNLVDPISVLFSIVLLSSLIVLGPLNGNLIHSVNGALGTLPNGSGIYSNANVSFAADEAYWAGSCSHGWTSDATCDRIVLNVQSCEVGLGSPYCLEYEDYMQQFFNQ